MTERPKRKSQAREAPRSNRARAVADMLPAVGGAAFRRFGFVQSSIVSRWPEIVGERYAGVSTPESIRFPAGKKSEGVLTLSVDGAHAVMIQHVGPAIIERVNRFFGYPAVAKVAIRQSTAPKITRSRAAPPSIRPVPQDLGNSLRTIADPELRDVLTALANAVAASTGIPRLNDK